MKDQLTQGNVRAIEVEAAGWIAQLSGDKFSNEDRAALREWCNRSPAHKEALKRLAGVWAELDILSDLPAELRSTEADKTKSPELRWSTFWVAHATVFAVVAVFAGVWVSGKVASNTPDSAVELYTTKIGEQQTIELADKSSIHLNTNTLVEVNYGHKERRIRLVKGEALFEVTKDANRPFTVYAAASSIQAIGTKFSVRLLQNDVQVIVSEGRVALFNSRVINVPNGVNAQSSVLETNELALIDDRSAASIAIGKIDSKELERRMSWTTGILDFDGEPLAEVVAEVSRYTPLRIRIAQPELGRLEVGGRFRIGETDALFEVIEASFGAKVVHQDDVVLITAN